MKKQLFWMAMGLFFIGCSGPEARKPIVRKTSSFMRESIERNKALNQLENEMLQRKMALDSLRTYISSEHGFWYAYGKKDSLSSYQPNKGDEVFYRHEIRDLRDSVLYSFDELGLRSYLVDRQELITGLQQGIKLMREGEEVTFLFPSHMAYGYTGTDRIGPNAPLIYQVELIKINKLSENEND